MQIIQSKDLHVKSFVSNGFISKKKNVKILERKIKIKIKTRSLLLIVFLIFILNILNNNLYILTLLMQ